MKIAGIDDLNEVTDMAMKFVKDTAYKDLADRNYISALAKQVLSAPNNQGIVILKPNIGMIAGHVAEFPFGPYLIASELCWWVEPDYRNTDEGLHLMEAFEYWAKEKANCKLITFSVLNTKLDKFFKKQGYKLREKAYMKKL